MADLNEVQDMSASTEVSPRQRLWLDQSSRQEHLARPAPKNRIVPYSARRDPLLKFVLFLTLLGAAALICPFTAIVVAIRIIERPEPIQDTSGANVDGGHFGLTLWSSANRARKGDRIKFRATVTNESEETQTLDAEKTAVFDLVIQQRTTTARWSDGKPLTPELTRLKLRPGQSKTIEMDWIAQYDNEISATIHLAEDQMYPRISVCVDLCPGMFGP